MSDITLDDSSTASAATIASEETSIQPTAQTFAVTSQDAVDVTALPDAPATAPPSPTIFGNELMAAASSSGFVANTGNINVVKPAKMTADFKMSLKSKQNSSDVIIFNISPTIDESRTANYDDVAPVHHPGTIQQYKNTGSRTFNVSAKLISRTSAEATTNIYYLNLIRSWVMPYYGTGTAASTNMLGAPPDILIFSAYGTKNLNAIPVVLLSYHWVYPDNVDYIPTTTGEPFPTILEITLSLIDAYSPEEYTGFDLIKYKFGDMVGAYTFSATPTIDSQVQTGT